MSINTITATTTTPWECATSSATSASAAQRSYALTPATAGLAGFGMERVHVDGDAKPTSGTLLGSPPR